MYICRYILYNIRIYISDECSHVRIYVPIEGKCVFREINCEKTNAIFAIWQYYWSINTLLHFVNI